MPAYRPRNRTMKERRRKAIVDALEKHYPAALSSRQIQDNIYDVLTIATPSTTTIGNLLRLLSSEGLVIAHATAALSPTFTYSFNPEAFQ